MKDLNKKLRIAFVLDRFIPSKGGENYFSWLIRELASRGHQIHVFTVFSEEATSSNYHLHLVPVLRYPPSLRILCFLIRFARLIKQYNFDIIHGVGRTNDINIFNPHGGVEKAYVKQDLISVKNKLYLMYKLLRRYVFLQHYIKVWIQKKQYSNVDVKRIIAISEMVKKDIVKYYSVPEEKVSILTNCVDLERFHPRNRELYRTSKRKELGIDEETIILLFAGNNYRLKGLEPLLKAVDFLRQQFSNQRVHLLVAGRGQINRYSKLAARLGIASSTTFLGHVDGMEQYYAASDIYVQPTFYDPCSLTVLEAFASGLPVITTRFNGAADVMTSDSGGRVIEDPTNIEDLAESIAFFFSEKHRNEARVVARQWMEKNPPAGHIEEILQVYFEVAGQT